jgi:hypothetical protein
MLGRLQLELCQTYGAENARKVLQSRTSAHPGALGTRSGVPEELAMYLARFSYDFLPVNRQRAVDFIKREVQAAGAKNLKARLLIPLTRGHGGAALQFEIEMKDLDQLDQFRRQDAGQWMHAFSEILTAPPEVAILRVDDHAG